MQPRPDCCPAPDLEVIRPLRGPPGPEEALWRCRGCGTYWRTDAEERMDFGGGEDHYREWFTRLTPAEAAGLLESSSQ
jgi:hypothetical protein